MFPFVLSFWSCDTQLSCFLLFLSGPRNKAVTKAQIDSKTVKQKRGGKGSIFSLRIVYTNKGFSLPLGLSARHAGVRTGKGPYQAHKHQGRKGLGKA